MSKRTTARFLALALSLCFVAQFAAARVISYAPYTDQAAFPGVQNRTNRFFVVIEGHGGFGGPILSPMPYWGSAFGEVVVYDSKGEFEPRSVFPGNNAFSMVAVFERPGAQTCTSPPPCNTAPVPVILVQTSANLDGQNPTNAWVMYLSTDGGSHWQKLDTPNNVIYQMPMNGVDVGGSFVRARYSPVRIGNASVPFVFLMQGKGVYAVDLAGNVRQLTALAAQSNGYQTLIGNSADGTRFLVRDGNRLLSVETSGRTVDLATFQVAPYAVEGWFSPEGDTFLEIYSSTGTSLKVLSASGQVTEFANIASSYSSSSTPNLFMVPTADYRGAWVVQRGNSQPTVLSRFTLATGLVKQWEDITAPEIEALHTGASGNTLLIQVHRPRQQADQRLFQDPALAVWRVGEPAPKAYDELFMNEQASKGFVHLDVDAVALGEPFVFDSGVAYSGGGVVISPAPVGGGGDVIQEWGIVRGSLKQKLVLPGIGRTPGAYGSDWVSDVIFQNPLDAKQAVALTFAPNGLDSAEAQPPVIGSSASANVRVITLEPREVRLVKDIMKTEFGLDNANGSLFIIPAEGVNATSRTYTRTSTGGTYGFNMNALDVFTAVGSRFPVSFAGAFPGQQFRTNLILTDTSTFGSAAQLTASGNSGVMGNANVAFSAPRNAQLQINGLGGALGLQPYETGGLMVAPTRGSLIASVFAIDNKTNDPTYFPPDLPAPIVRTIPAIGHVDGANNSKFRSDLYLYNPAPTPRTVTLQAKMWDSDATIPVLNLTLLPHETKIIQDALSTAFSRTGIARLRYTSVGDSLGVRVTSRTYSIDENGGTYGFLMPPLNNFQTAGGGDTLEILGAVNDPNFRTNIGLVELSAFASSGTPASVKIEILDNQQKTIDSFTVPVAAAGGSQLNDIFRARNLTQSGALVIRVTPLTGMVGAYASLVDNITNDSTYLAANLAAK